MSLVPVWISISVLGVTPVIFSRNAACSLSGRVLIILRPPPRSALPRDVLAECIVGGRSVDQYQREAISPCCMFPFVNPLRLAHLAQAGRLTVGAQKRVKHKDKRNVYLADEGLVVEDSAAAEGAAKGDLEKRVQARRDKKTKLKNPVRARRRCRRGSWQARVLT